tara:strand:+ start:771 stop:1118 length:348 start_codon:yes stop_codon:yes gene_type:complete
MIHPKEQANALFQGKYRKANGELLEVQNELKGTKVNAMEARKELERLSRDTELLRGENERYRREVEDLQRVRQELERKSQKEVKFHSLGNENSSLTSTHSVPLLDQCQVGGSYTR